MKARAVGIICPLCGDAAPLQRFMTWSDCWMGYTRSFYHGCQPDGFNQEYLLLYDEQKAFIGIIPGSWSWISSAGIPVHDSNDEDIPF